MLTTNTIVSTLGGYMPTMASVNNWIAPHYDWVKSIPVPIKPDTDASYSVYGISYYSGSAASLVDSWNLAQRAREHATTLASTEWPLALTSALNAASCADRMLEGATGMAVGIGKCGAVTNGLMACAMLADYAKNGDVAGVGLSAAKLSAIAMFGCNPGVDAAVDFLCTHYNSYRDVHPLHPVQPQLQPLPQQAPQPELEPQREPSPQPRP